MGLAYLASALKKKDHDVTLVDAETIIFNEYKKDNNLFKRIKGKIVHISKLFKSGFDSFKSIMEDPEHHMWDIITSSVVISKPDLIGITVYSQNITAVQYLAEKLKASLPQVPVVLGGIHPTSYPEMTMRQIEYVDYIVVGEGEETFAELCTAVSTGEKETLSKINGIAFRENSQIKFSSPRKLIQNLDSLSFPDRLLGNRNDYQEADRIFTTRGCPFNCSFCASSTLWKRKVRFRSIENVLSEIDLLINRYNSKKIHIDDDTFTLSKKRVVDFCSEIKKRGFDRKVSFALSSRVDTLDKEMIELLAGSGVARMSFGIESGSPKVLDNIKKGITTSQAEDIIRFASNCGIQCMCFFMIGLPGETVDDVKQSIELFKKIAINRFVDAELNILSPYPGTELWSLAKEKGFNISTENYYKLFHQGNFLVNLSDMTEDELNYWYDLFLKQISRHSMISKFKKLVYLIRKGKIKTLKRSVFN